MIEIQLLAHRCIEALASVETACRLCVGRKWTAERTYCYTPLAIAYPLVINCCFLTQLILSIEMNDLLSRM